MCARVLGPVSGFPSRAGDSSPLRYLRSLRCCASRSAAGLRPRGSVQSVPSSPGIVCAGSRLSEANVWTYVGVTLRLPPCEPGVPARLPPAGVHDEVRNPKYNAEHDREHHGSRHLHSSAPPNAVDVRMQTAVLWRARLGPGRSQPRSRVTRVARDVYLERLGVSEARITVPAESNAVSSFFAPPCESTAFRGVTSEEPG
jgi:hypothetical protein